MPQDTTVKAPQFVKVAGGSLMVLSPATGEAVGVPVAIGVEPCVVGRGQHCRLSLDDAQVSTSHCALIATNHGVRVTDLGSTNGTYVGQVRLDRHNSAYLKTDARLRCGQVWLQFRATGSEQVPLSASPAFGPLVGGSVVMRRIYSQIAKVAPHDLNVLITGETGTGKELVAQAIHQASRRAAGPFVVVDCTTILSALAESHLFGHERGAFTGAVTKRVSPFLAAQGGTIFFDELGELPEDVQPKLLRALESRRVQSVGSTRWVPVDVRVIAATRRNLHAAINARRFRDDLYYRFAQVVLDLPPLRERAEDIPAIVAHLLAVADDPGAIHRIDQPAMNRLLRHDWPGNVRELRNLVLAAHAQSTGGPIEVADFLSSREHPIDLGPPRASLGLFAVRKRELLDAFEREYFAQLHRDGGGNVSEMARRSGLSRPMIREYLARHGLRGHD